MLHPSLLLARVALAGATLSPILAAQDLPPHVTPETATTVANGLSWLAGVQREDGSWDADPGRNYPVAMTALAGLAFVSAGNTPTRGPYAARVRAASTGSSPGRTAACSSSPAAGGPCTATATRCSSWPRSTG